MEEELTPIREKRHYYETHIDEVYDILRNGTNNARKKAREVLKRLKDNMKINYFDNEDFKKLINEKYSK